MMPGPISCVNCCKLYRVTGVYKEKIWKRLTERSFCLSAYKYWSQRVLSDSYWLVWLIDESIQHHENKTQRVKCSLKLMVSWGRSFLIKTRHGFHRLPLVQLAPLRNKSFEIKTVTTNWRLKRKNLWNQKKINFPMIVRHLLKEVRQLCKNIHRECEGNDWKNYFA